MLDLTFRIEYPQQDPKNIPILRVQAQGQECRLLHQGNIVLGIRLGGSDTQRLLQRRKMPATLSGTPMKENRALAIDTAKEFGLKRFRQQFQSCEDRAAVLRVRKPEIGARWRRFELDGCFAETKERPTELILAASDPRNQLAKIDLRAAIVVSPQKPGDRAA